MLRAAGEDQDCCGKGQACCGWGALPRSVCPSLTVSAVSINEEAELGGFFLSLIRKLSLNQALEQFPTARRLTPQSFSASLLLPWLRRSVRGAKITPALFYSYLTFRCLPALRDLLSLLDCVMSNAEHCLKSKVQLSLLLQLL